MLDSSWMKIENWKKTINVKTSLTEKNVFLLNISWKQWALLVNIKNHYFEPA